MTSQGYTSRGRGKSCRLRQPMQCTVRSKTTRSATSSPLTDGSICWVIPSDQAAQDPYPQYEVTDAQADAIADGALKRLRGPRKYNRTNVRAAVNIALATRRRQQQQLAGLPADAEDVGGADGGGADGNGNGGGVGGAGPVDVDGREVGGEGQGHGGGKNTRGVQEIPNDPNPGILDPDDDPNSPFTPARFWRSLSSPRYDLRSGGGSGSESSTVS